MITSEDCVERLVRFLPIFPFDANVLLAILILAFATVC